MQIPAAILIPTETLLVEIVAQTPYEVVLTHLVMKHGVMITETRSEAEQTHSEIEPTETVPAIPHGVRLTRMTTQPAEIVPAIPHGVGLTRMATQRAGDLRRFCAED